MGFIVLGRPWTAIPIFLFFLSGGVLRASLAFWHIDFGYTARHNPCHRAKQPK